MPKLKGNSRNWKILEQFLNHKICKLLINFFVHSITMSRKSIIFDDKKINKNNFYKNKKLFKIDNIDVNKILVSKKEPYGKISSFKCFIGYNYNDNIRTLCIKFPQMIGYAKYFDDNKTMSSDKKL